MLGAMIEQLNQYGVEVLWSQSIVKPGVWIASHSLLVLKVGAETAFLAGCCGELISFLDSDPRPSLHLET